MLELNNIDLRNDPHAALYVKNEVVQVCFAKSDGELISQEGPNRYSAGDAMITGSTGNRWTVSRERFDAKYEPVAPVKANEDGAYRNKPMPVLAKQLHEPFSINRSAGGDRLRGRAGDWLMQYGPNDFGIVEKNRFEQVYQRVDQ
jgi:hypothetical protein